MNPKAFRSGEPATLHDHQAAVLEAHARYSAARQNLAEIDKAREQAANAMESARAEMDALATRAK